jgi:hypothetical protein
MNRIMKRLYIFLLAIPMVFAGVSCENEEILEQWLKDNPPVQVPPVTGSPGALNLSNFVVLGTSLASGIQDGALYTDGQNLSFPALLAKQFNIQGVGGGDFYQPNIGSVNGYHVIFNPTGIEGLVIGRTYLDLVAQAPAPTVGELFGAYTGPPVHNVSAPLLYAGQLAITETGGSAGMGHPYYSPFYARFATSPGTSTPLSQALAKQGTFFVYEASMNDVLLYALTGGDGTAPLTASGTYQAINNDIIENLARNPLISGNYNTPGVVVNVPPVHVFPFFRAIRWNQIVLDGPTAGALNAGFAGFNAALDAIVANLGHDPEDADRRRVVYAAGNNPILVIDEELEDLGPKFDVLLAAEAITPAQRAALVPYEQSRPLVNGELVLLTAAAGGRLGQNWAGANTTIGVVIPLGLTNDMELDGDKYYLDLDEVGAITTAVTNYNVALGTIVATKAAAGAQLNYVNIASNIYADAAGADGTLGIVVDGFTLSPDFAPNGIYSTDGVHFNPRGNALIANEIIKVMNATWGASIPAVDVISQRSVYFSAN